MVLGLMSKKIIRVSKVVLLFSILPILIGSSKIIPKPALN